MSKAGEALKEFAGRLQAQVRAAKAAGADQMDLCVHVPPGYLVLRAGMPVIDLDGEPRALITYVGAEELIDTMNAEAGKPIMPPRDDSAGLWQTL